MKDSLAKEEMIDISNTDLVKKLVDEKNKFDTIHDETQDIIEKLKRKN